MKKIIRKWIFPQLFFLWVLLVASTAHATKIYGYVEKVLINPGQFVAKAKLDTGAVSASLNAVHLVEFSKDGERWVRFEIPVENEANIKLERKLVKYVRIKTRRGELKKGFKRAASRRPVVKMQLTIGSETKMIEVNLANRQDFNYPLLLGRKPLILFDIAVNPAETFVSVLKGS